MVGDFIIVFTIPINYHSDLTDLLHIGNKRAMYFTKHALQRVTNCNVVVVFSANSECPAHKELNRLGDPFPIQYCIQKQHTCLY